MKLAEGFCANVTIFCIAEQLAEMRYIVSRCTSQVVSLLRRSRLELYVQILLSAIELFSLGAFAPCSQEVNKSAPTRRQQLASFCLIIHQTVTVLLLE